MSASPATTLPEIPGAAPAEPRRPRATTDVVVKAIDRSWRRHVVRFQKAGERFTGDDLIPDVLDDLERRGYDTGKHAIQEVLAELVRLHMLLERKAVKIAQSRLPANIIPLRPE